DRLEQALEHTHLGRREALHQAEVEERHPTAGAEEVVARMGVAVEGVQPVQAANDEPEDGLGGQVALLLTPRRAQLLEAAPLVQLAGEHPGSAVAVAAGRDVDEGVPGVRRREQALVPGLEAAAD